MEVILSKDVEKIGLRGDVVSVARGYARNFLALWDHLNFLDERERVIRLRELRDGEEVELGKTTIRPLRLAQDFVYGFLFYDDGRVVYVSMHEYPLYPGTGRLEEVGTGAGEGATVNLPFPAGTGREP